jgi:hypothetical protein
VEGILKSFPFGLLLRGVFPGGFFLLSFFVAKNGWQKLGGLTDQIQLVPWIVIAVFCGIAIYTFHRSIIYPIVEYFMDLCCPCRWFPLISTVTSQRLIDRWKMGDDSQGNCRLREHISGWADYAHLQYTSCLCIVAGMVLAGQRDPKLIWLAAAFLASALVSDWRLRHIVDTLQKKSTTLQ